MQIYHIGDRMGIVLSLSSQKMDSPNSSNSCSFAFCWIHDSDWSCHPVTLSKICLRSAHEFRRPFGSPKRKRIWTISGYTGVFIFPTTMMCYQGRSNHSKSHKVTISRTSGCAKLSLDDSNIFCCLGFFVFFQKKKNVVSWLGFWLLGNACLPDLFYMFLRFFGREITPFQILVTTPWWEVQVLQNGSRRPKTKKRSEAAKNASSPPKK